MRCVDDVSFAGMHCVDDVSLAVEEVWSLVLFFLRSDEICWNQNSQALYSVIVAQCEGCEGERQYRTLISLLGSLATMRRVVNYHSSWARQRQVELFDASDKLLQENIPNLELGESSEFPASKILTKKTVHRYVSLNDKVGAEEAAGAPKPKAASKKRPAAVLGDEPVVKKKRTMKKKSSSSKVNLEIVAVAQEAVPKQMVEPSTAASAAEDILVDEIPADPPADEVDGETVDEEAADEGAYEETADGDAARVNEPASEPAVADIVNEEPSIADDVDVIIEQVLADTAQIRVDEEDQVVRSSGEGNQPAGTAEERQWFDLPYDDLIARWDAERIVTTPSDMDEEIETERAVGTADGVQTESTQPEYIVEKPENMEMSDDE
ncbi:sucrose synthase [Dorcoceras hygrometricum]|uniref:Sucrose synthase n=1 Tax=Dorcoceras hygrometricum TaxID=472368 RepID=A0A2Z7B8R1_9LAMI|nr:sucrose synthase [Dorcoceras hygrometricum]